MTTRSEALAEWERCTWCWRPLPEAPVKKGGYPYCDDRCAGRDIAVVDERAAEPAGDQLDLLDGGE